MNSGELSGFEERALALFRWQAFHNPVYRQFVQAMRVNPELVNDLHDIPCLPVEFFKTMPVKSGEWDEVQAFRSSGTSTTSERACHLLDEKGEQWYHQVADRAWEEVWLTEVNSHEWLGLLPGYVGREDASLLSMVSHFMAKAGQDANRGMLMNEPDALMSNLLRWAQREDRKPLVLFGVTWAILDWIAWLEQGEVPRDAIPWSDILLVETGGMKGRGEEPIREEVHARILNALPRISIASEYGMTEMMSQGYAQQGIHHRFPKWVRPLIRDPRDPRGVMPSGRMGRLDVIDLGNVHSCAFLATGDAAQMAPEGLVLLGRTDHAEVRGCSLLAAP